VRVGVPVPSPGPLMETLAPHHTAPHPPTTPSGSAASSSYQRAWPWWASRGVRLKLEGSRWGPGFLAPAHTPVETHPVDVRTRACVLVDGRP
jgi:hypothetical protein